MHIFINMEIKCQIMAYITAVACSVKNELVRKL